MKRILLSFLLVSASAMAQQTGGGGGVPGGGGSGASTKPLDPTYTFYVQGGITYARNESTLAIDFSGTDAAVVINSALNAIATKGGTLYFKNGTYSLNSVTQETVGPYTNYYAVGIPSANTPTYPQFNFVGESSVVSSNTISGVIFDVTAAALTTAGAGNRVDAFWMRPSTDHSLGFYWNSSVFFQNIGIQFPDNQRGNEHGIDVLEASYLSLVNVGTYFVTAPTVRGATDTISYVSPATYSDGVYMENAISEPGWDTGFQINTEHSVLINTVAFENTTAYSFGAQQNRTLVNIGHGSTWLHPQVYDCVNPFVAGPFINPSTQLDIVNLDDEYTTTGNWQQAQGMVTGSNLGGFISWGDIHTSVGPGNLTTIFAPGSGGNYVSENNGVFGTTSIISASNPLTITGTMSTPFYELAMLAPNLAPGNAVNFSLGTSASTNNNLYFQFYNSGSGSSSNAFGFQFYGEGHDSFHAVANGNNGIDTSSPNFPLDVHGEVNTDTGVKLPVYTVATLPSASTLGAGAQVIVSDATATIGTCTAGGTNTYMIAVSTGSAWTCH
jgi:hypothetical protein